jgi:hypothetical protein
MPPAPARDPLDVLRLTATRLTEAGFAYMWTGPLALNAYGESRVVQEFELVVRMRTTDAEWIAALFSHDFDLDPDSLERAAFEAGTATLVHREGGVRFWCHALPREGYYPHAFDRRSTVVVLGASLSVAAPEDLLLWCILQNNQPRGRGGLDDARALLARVPSVDSRYLEEWAAELQVATDLAAVRRA